MKMIPSHVTETATISAFYVPPISVIAPVHSVAWHRVEQQNAEHCECVSVLFCLLLSSDSSCGSSRTAHGWLLDQRTQKWQKETKRNCASKYRVRFFNFTIFSSFILLNDIKKESKFSRVSNIVGMCHRRRTELLSYMKWNISTFFFSLTFLSYAAM